MPDQLVHAHPAASAAWLRDARTTRALSVATLVWLAAESSLGLLAGFSAHSVALIGWGLSALVEAGASLVVLWRFSGSRTLSHIAEERAQKAVAVSFWLLAPYLVVHVLHDLDAGHRAVPSLLGIVVTSLSLVGMPVLALAKRRLARRLGSGATAGEAAQNLICAAMAGGVLAGLGLGALGWWWADPLIALGLAGLAVREGVRAWQGHVCGH
ncbi:cation transporter [Nonomuraea longicatena]|uniref:Cation transporter n=1 Tax=Nonomuraea longicatena TaxID=83682 RepID=A0ABN1NS16_9ACTN